jgi:hypothetical protein
LLVGFLGSSAMTEEEEEDMLEEDLSKLLCV